MKLEFDRAAFAKAVKMKRHEIGIGLEMLSAITDVGVSTIGRIEGGEWCHVKSFTKLCSWLEVPPGEFFKFVEG